MSKWVNVTPNQPCEVCGAVKWCSRSEDGSALNCRHQQTSEKFGEGRSGQDANGNSFWTFRTSPTSTSSFSPSLSPSADKAEADTLHAVYSTVLDELTIGHAATVSELSRRGLSTVRVLQFQQYGYRWLSKSGRPRIARVVLRKHGEQAVASTPGFVIRENKSTSEKYWTISGTEGIVFPIRDANGRIVALNVRPATPLAKCKYLWLSSRNQRKGDAGASPGTPVHVPLSTADRQVIRVTEGSLKADVTTSLSGILTIGLPGLAWKKALPVLKELGATTVLVAFDADWRTNPNVLKAITSLVDQLTSNDFRVIMEVWNPEDGKGIDDVLAAGKSIQQINDPEEIQTLLATAAVQPQVTISIQDKTPKRPTVVLPGRGVEISQSAAELGALLGATGAWFRRGSAVLNLSPDDDGQPTLRQCRSATLPSAFETVAEIKVLREGENGLVKVPAICSEQSAKLIMHADRFLESLPPIRILAQSPVLVESAGELIEVIGYHRESGVLAFGEPTEDVSLLDAVSLLKSLVRDFKFSSTSDESRAIAAMITPALVQGGLLRGRSPIDLGEADQSQTGKGFRNKITAAIYRQSVRAVTQRSGGVGSLEESLNTALISGANFIALDNVRGKIDSPAIESMLTEDAYLARVPHAAAIEVDPRRVVIMMTSNKAQVTDDLANRSSCVRLLKQDPGYQFQHFAEGDVLEHVRTHQAKYLGAVFAIIKEWHRQGCPRSVEVRHDFRRWAQTLDWIVQNLLGCDPLLDGHEAAQQRISNPNLNWFRDVALRVCQSPQEGRWIRTNEILEILIEAGDVEIPGVKDDQDVDSESIRATALRQIGVKLGRCFKGQQFIDVDNIQIDRNESTDDQYRKRFDYKFSISPAAPRSSPAATPAVNADTPAVPAVFSSTAVENKKHSLIPYIESNAITAGVAGYYGVKANDRGVNNMNGNERLLCPNCGFDADQENGLCTTCQRLEHRPCHGSS